MGTRSNIVTQLLDGSWKSVYCHWDGYPAGVGRTLLDNYNSQERAESVVSLGDISSLRPRNDGAPGHSFDSPVDDQTIYYGRDRGETGTDARAGNALTDVWPAADSWVEYIYVWLAGGPDGANQPNWYVGDPDVGPDSLRLLSAVLAGDASAPQPDIKSPFGVLGHRDPARAGQ